MRIHAGDYFAVGGFDGQVKSRRDPSFRIINNPDRNICMFILKNQ